MLGQALLALRYPMYKTFVRKISLPRSAGLSFCAPPAARIHGCIGSFQGRGILVFGDASIPALRNQPVALVRRHLIFLDCAGDGGLRVRRIVDDADQLRGRALDVVDGPGIQLLLLGRLLGHSDGYNTRSTVRGIEMGPRHLQARPPPTV